jgi:hypothetical protein
MTNSSTLTGLATELEAKRWQSMLQRDVDALSDLLSNDLRYVHSSGATDQKVSHLGAIDSGAVVYKSADYNLDVIIPLGKDAFIASGNIRISVVLRAEPRQMHSIFTVVWRKESGVWRLVSHQTTLIPH